MGGSAFSAILASSSFPRLPPVVYRTLKSSLMPTLGQYYRYVAVPMEAPEKPDYGDLDLLVALPQAPFGSAVPHDVLKKALGATIVNEMEGNRTSNYGIPIRRGEWSSLGHAVDEARFREGAENGEIFYQVDVHVCADTDEWDRIRFYHSYGDMGMILGLVGRNAGLQLGLHGLKLPDPPNPPFLLSTSFADIMRFLGISMEVYRAGFQTKREVFQWVASSPFLDPRDFQYSGQGFTKVKKERVMYGEFVEWIQHLQSTQPGGVESATLPSRAERHARIRAEALDFFGKTEEYAREVESRSNKLKLKKTWSGSTVRDWTDLGEHWGGVKRIMDEVRVRLGGDEGVLAYLNANGEDSLKQQVLEVKKDLGILGVFVPADAVRPASSD